MCVYMYNVCICKIVLPEPCLGGDLGVPQGLLPAARHPSAFQGPVGPPAFPGSRDFRCRAWGVSGFGASPDARNGPSELSEESRV